MYSTMPRQEISFDDTKLSDCPHITKSLIVIATAKGGVDPCSWPSEASGHRCQVITFIVAFWYQGLGEQKWSCTDASVGSCR